MKLHTRHGNKQNRMVGWDTSPRPSPHLTPLPLSNAEREKRSQRLGQRGVAGPRVQYAPGRIWCYLMATMLLCFAFSTNVPARSDSAKIVDASTMNHKLLMGYQGWFACPGDGSPVNRWVHWFRNNNSVAENATVDLWPDVSELGADELFATSMTLPNGTPAKVYSAYTPKTVLRHFKWMQQYDLDGVFLQRFVSTLHDPRSFALRNQVTANVQAGAEKYGRVFAIMYDISGQPGDTLVGALTNDWNFLVHTQHITDSPRYLRHRGHPVVAIWGLVLLTGPALPSKRKR